MNQSELTLLVLRIGFLLLMWLFVFAVVYALRTDLFGQRARKLSAEAKAAAGVRAAPTGSAGTSEPAASSSGSSGASRSVATVITAHKLVITSGPKEGTELSLGREPLTIGRSSESGLIIRDDYTSTHHARLVLWDDTWMLQDLDSTNGTFLGETRIKVPTQVTLNTPIRIGTTTFELRR